MTAQPTVSAAALLDEPVLLARKVFALIAAELAAVEAEFERQAASNIQVIAYIGDYLRASGGKRVRPALNLLATHAVGGDGAAENAIRMATAMEFLHTATLVHDDIIDNAEMRRSKPSVNSRFGNQTAVLMGDWLYMSAFETSLKERSLSILDILTGLTRKMTEGELIQLTMLGKTDVTQLQYFDVLRRKTAYLFSACCEIGAIVGNADEAQRTALREFGLNLGIAFQLADDLLDLTAVEAVVGKPTGADLLEGKLTLPLILLLERAPDWRFRLRTVIDEGAYQSVARHEIISALQQTGCLAETQLRADEYAAAAKASLQLLPDSAYKDALAALPDYVIIRDR